MKRFNPHKGYPFVIVLLLLSVFLLNGCNYFNLKPGSLLTFHFNKPASIWEESLPLGNGRIGMMPDGGVNREEILLNDISMWSGSKQNTDNPLAYYSLGTIRQLLFEGRNEEAQELMYQTFVTGGVGSGHGKGANVPYGSYQLLGYLTIDHQYEQTNKATVAYRRDLNLENAVSTISYTRGTINYTREYFTSFAEDIGVIRLTANGSGSLRFALGMNRPEHYEVSTDGKELVMKGRLPDGVDTLHLKGTQYEARVRVVLPQGGLVTPGDSTIEVSNTSEAILLVSMATDYFVQDAYQSQIEELLDNAAAKTYTELKQEHTEAYDRLFGRVSLTLDDNGRSALPMDERLYAFAKDKDDPALAALYFQYGRYLLISSTRPGLLPPNLQGLWCNTIDTPWNGDYHLNINLQMNLWPAEVTNLSELHLPMIEWTKQQVESGKRTARVFYNARGWVTHILGNVWEFTAPGEHPSWGATNTSAAWLCAHLYQHYQYTLDKEYLADVYPTMKDAALFFVDMLIEDPRNGYLVTAPTTSPENGYRLESGGKVIHVCAGSTMDNQIVRELFTNTIEAAKILNIDSDFSDLLTEKRSRLMPTTVAQDGRIMEWLEPFIEAEPTHRHVSHLYGLYPGDEITMNGTPALAEAARKTLEVRGDESTGWSMAWKINFWARLHDGDHAFKLLADLLRPCIDQKTNKVSGGTYPNLFCSHPPFQIDGNFGGTAGIAEMLLQCQEGYIHVLPALPSAWPNGEFSGLKVRGGGEVSAKWEKGMLEEISLEVSNTGSYSIKLPDHSENIQIKLNGKLQSLPVIDGILTISLVQNDRLILTF